MHSGSELVVGLILGAVIAGAVCGLMPLAVGRSLGRTGEGIAAFALCLGSAFFGGFVIAGPLALVLSVALCVLGNAEPPLPPAGFDSAAHEERVATLRALARARKERTDLPVPEQLPPRPVAAELEHAIQAAPPVQAISESARTYSTPS